MKLKDRIKTMSFWIGLIGSVFLILGAFGIEIGDETANSVINAVCSVLVVFGVVSAPQKENAESEEKDCEISTADEEVSDVENASADIDDLK